MIGIGSWTPDLPELQVSGALEKLNVIPEKGYCRPLPSFATTGGSIGGRVRGAISVRGINGTVHNFAGTATALKKWDSTGNNWTDVSRLSGGAYSVPTEGGWSFSLFGDSVLADNGSDAGQRFILSSDTNFAALAGSPPVASYSATMRDFHVKARVNAIENRVHWSGINNLITYASSQATQADFQDLPDGGRITGIVGGEYGLVFQEKSVKRMTYDNLPLIWRFDEISRGLGTPAPGSIARYESVCFFLSEQGFYMVSGGSQFTPIGNGRVDHYFWGDATGRVNESFLYRCSATVDPLNHLYILSYPSTNSLDGTPDRLLIYNWAANEWARAEVTLDLLHQAATQAGFTLDTLDAVFGDLDSIDVSLDSTLFSGSGKLLLAGFGTDFMIGFFNGQNMAATVDTREDQLFPYFKAGITGLRPLVDGGTPKVRLGRRDRATDARTYGTQSVMNIYGICPLNEESRYHLARLEMDAGEPWTKMQGVDEIEAVQMGRV